MKHKIKSLQVCSPLSSDCKPAHQSFIRKRRKQLLDVSEYDARLTN